MQLSVVERENLHQLQWNKCNGKIFFCQLSAIQFLPDYGTFITIRMIRFQALDLHI